MVVVVCVCLLVFVSEVVLLSYKKTAQRDNISFSSLIFAGTATMIKNGPPDWNEESESTCRSSQLPSIGKPTKEKPCNLKAMQLSNRMRSRHVSFA